MSSLLVHGRRLRRHLGWMGVAGLSLWVMRATVSSEVLSAMAGVGGNVLQTFGGMYGVIVAFAIFVTWQQHNDTQIAVEREAVSLVELFRALGWFESWKDREQVRSVLHRYALVVPANNTPASRAEKGDEAALLEGAQALFFMHAPAAGREERLYESALGLFHELNEARAHRETVASLRLPDSMRWFVYLGGALCVLTTDTMWIADFRAHLAMVLVMTWVVVAATTTVIDLDDPFDGDFVVDWNRLELAAQAMEKIRGAATASGPAAPVAPASAQAVERPPSS